MKKVHEELNTVHEKDLKRLLEHFGIYESFIDGLFKCKFCKQIVTTDNLYSVLPQSGAVNFICSKPMCIADLGDYLEEKKQ